MTLTLILLVLSVVLGLVLSPTTHHAKVFQHHASDARILLLTAHPDDECMFFAPTLLGLLGGEDARKPTLFSLCLSIGDADGLGDVRRTELARSLDVLGVPEGRRWFLDHPDLKDNITVTWDPLVIAAAIEPYVLENGITTILTFDHHGISSHPNHISLQHGASEFLTPKPRSSEADGTMLPRLFVLTTVPLAQKYTGILAPLLAKAKISLTQITAPSSVAFNRHAINADASPVFVSSAAGYKTALRAMLQHRSQLVWFRWLYVAFSRYMWVNEWIEVVPAH